MGTVGSVTVNLDARSVGWMKGLNETGAGTSRWAKDISREFGNLTFASGAGAVGIAKFGGSLGRIAGDAADFASVVRTGGDAAGAFGKIVDGIPIVGPFKQAGEAIRELVTGEKAAAEAAKELGDAAERTSAIYHQMSMRRELTGKFGVDRSLENAKIAEDARRQGLDKQISDKQKEIDEVQQYQNLSYKDNGYEGFMTKAQVEKFHALDAEHTALQKAAQNTTEYEQKKIDITRDAAERTRSTLHGLSEERLSIQAATDEKVLRRMGKPLESAIRAEQEKSRAFAEGARERITTYALENMRESDRVKVIAEVNAEIADNEKDTQEKIAKLKDEKKFRDLGRNQEIAHKSKEIDENARIENLKLTDERINVKYELEGRALRSHLAESAQIEQKYRKSIDDANKEFGERAHTGDIEPAENEKIKNAAIINAGKERSAALALINQKEIDGLQKKFADEVTLTQSYQAELADINKLYGATGDKAARDKQIKKLDQNTLNKLSELNPSHKRDISELSGSRLAHHYDRLNTDPSRQIAERQLEEIKKQSDSMTELLTKMQPIYDWFRANFAGTPLELKI